MSRQKSIVLHDIDLRSNRIVNGGFETWSVLPANTTNTAGNDPDAFIGKIIDYIGAPTEAEKGLYRCSNIVSGAITWTRVGKDDVTLPPEVNDATTTTKGIVRIATEDKLRTNEASEALDVVNVSELRKTLTFSLDDDISGKPSTLSKTTAPTVPEKVTVHKSSAVRFILNPDNLTNGVATPNTDPNIGVSLEGTFNTHTGGNGDAIPGATPPVPQGTRNPQLVIKNKAGDAIADLLLNRLYTDGDVQINEDLQVSGDVVVEGNLTVNGTTVTLNTTTLEVEDNVIVLNKNATGTPSLDSGIEVERGSADNAKVLWNESTDKWQAGTQNDMKDISLDGHTHLWAHITDKPTTFAPAAHTHAISDVTGLQTALDGKANSTHTHTISDVTGLQAALNGKATKSTHSSTTIAIGTIDFNTGITITHNLNTDYPIVQVYKIDTKELISVVVKSTGVNTITISGNSTTTPFAMQVVVIG